MKIGQLEGLPDKKHITENIDLNRGGKIGFNECKDIYDGIEIEMNVEGILYVLYDRDTMGTKIYEKNPEEISKAIANNIERIVRRK